MPRRQRDYGSDSYWIERFRKRARSEEDDLTDEWLITFDQMRPLLEPHIPCGAAVLDLGSGFDTSSGEFAAPVDGLYFVMFTVYSGSNDDSLAVQLFVDGEYACFGDDYWRKFDARTMRHDDAADLALQDGDPLDLLCQLRLRRLQQPGGRLQLRRDAGHGCRAGAGGCQGGAGGVVGGCRWSRRGEGRCL